LHFRATETRKNMSNRKAAVALPILDPKASAARDYPVWALEEWKKKHRLYPPKEAIRQKHVRCQLVGEPPEAPEGMSYPKFIQTKLCTDCRGEGEPTDPMIVGCRIYSCELWPFRFGKNPNRQAAGRGTKNVPPGRRKPQNGGEGVSR
jgi:hypothetical protein